MSDRHEDEVIADDPHGLADHGDAPGHKHDDHGQDDEPLGPIDWPAYGAGALGGAREGAREVALAVREVLEDLGYRGFPKTSGSRGMHIYVRIEPKWGFPDVRRCALALGREVERRIPALSTTKWWKEERHGVFIDYNQNARDRTIASAYSVRPMPDARVSTPLEWDEVPDVDPAAFTMATVPARFAERGDPSAPIDDVHHSLEPLLELVQKHEREGEGDAPWPPQFPKAEGEPPRVQPSRRKKT